jgi:uncharacterized membrane protein YeaQ/YmgE (transglycosylase-associated protein family)
MLTNLISAFVQSPQGQTAFNRLQSQGFAPNQASALLQAAVPTAAQAFHGAQAGGMGAARPAGPDGIMDIGSSNYATNFLSGAVSSLLRGEGLMGAAMDGVSGVVGGHVAQLLASRFGLPQRTAGVAGAIITPLLVDFLWDRVHNGGLDLGALLGGGQPSAQGPQPASPQGGWGAPPQLGGGRSGPGAGGGLGAVFANLLNG